jgi:hypothetical protein
LQFGHNQLIEQRRDQVAGGFRAESNVVVLLARGSGSRLVRSPRESRGCGELATPDIDAESLFQFTTVRYWVTLMGTWDRVHLIAKHFFQGGR